MTPWVSSRRRKDPTYWPKLRAEILQRALGMCEHTETQTTPEGSKTIRCTYPAQDIDHIVNLARGGTDSPDNLQALCSWHHKRKTQLEAAEGRKRNPPITERRARETHPGLTE